MLSVVLPGVVMPTTGGLLPQVDRDSADTRLKVAEANYSAALDTVRSLKAALQDRRAAYLLPIIGAGTIRE